MSSTTSRRRCSSSTKISPKPGENCSPSRASPRRLLHLAGDPMLESPIRSLLLQQFLILMNKYASPCLFRARAEFLEHRYHNQLHYYTSLHIITRFNYLLHNIITRFEHVITLLYSFITQLITHLCIFITLLEIFITHHYTFYYTRIHLYYM